MNKQSNRFIGFVAVILLAFFSCNKEGIQVRATQGTQPGLTASTNKLQFVEADSANTALTFNWTKSDFGYPAAISYTLQFSYKDSAFSKFSSFGLGTLLTKTFTVADFNTLLAGLKFDAGVLDTVYVRVMAQVADSLYRFSDVVKVTATPYLIKRVISYPSLFVPGAYQGWTTNTAGEIIAKLYSAAGNSAYEGYVNLPDATNDFKLTPLDNWNNSYGMVDSTKMVYNAGGNFELIGAGYYLLTANTQTLTWSALVENWSMIGDFNGWGADLNFDFDPVNQVLTKTVVLPIGGLKLRTNGEWNAVGKNPNPNYGGSWDVNTGKVSLVLGGGNITITVAGTYLVTLDLRVPSEPLCTIVKQ